MNDGNSGDGITFSEVSESAGVRGGEIVVRYLDGEPITFPDPDTGVEYGGYDPTMLDAGGNRVAGPVRAHPRGAVLRPRRRPRPRSVGCERRTSPLRISQRFYARKSPIHVHRRTDGHRPVRQLDGLRRRRHRQRRGLGRLHNQRRLPPAAVRAARAAGAATADTRNDSIGEPAYTTCSATTERGRRTGWASSARSRTWRRLLR